MENFWNSKYSLFEHDIVSTCIFLLENRKLSCQSLFNYFLYEEVIEILYSKFAQKEIFDFS